MKAYAKKDGVLKFDGLPWFEPPVSDLTALPAQEATKKGILIVNERRTFLCPDVVGENNLPCEFTVSLRIERTPATHQEEEQIARSTEQKDKAKAQREEKETNTRREVYEVVANTAVKAATGSRTQSTLEQQIIAGVLAKSGILSLNPGNN